MAGTGFAAAHAALYFRRVWLTKSEGTGDARQVRALRGMSGDRFGGETMTMMDRAMGALRATVMEALGLNGKANEIRSRGLRLTSLDEVSGIILHGRSVVRPGA
ncbi:MAG: hypothetical protein F4X42_15400 [Rhodospirillaceae bacterium]|nr:hypothetical protein [Rhodospirillaceae bacterium]MYB14625.1 hypothetical protein [Rhodospirillaceae bacterium]